jgi:error-prone DNA polymerase
VSPILPEYAELHCVSNFSFLRGASHAQELVERAKALGYRALAIADDCSLAGIVRAHVDAKEADLHLLIGAEFTVQAMTPFRIVVLATNRNGYGNLSETITRLRMSSAEKGAYRLDWNDLWPGWLDDCLLLYVPDRLASDETLYAQANWFDHHFEGRAWIAVELTHALDDASWLARLRGISRLANVPLVAAGDVHMHARSRKPLQDTLTAIRVGKPLQECGIELLHNAEKHLRSRLALAQVYPEDLMAETMKIAGRCSFSLDELTYEYPEEVVPEGETPASYLRRLTYEGSGRRFPRGVPAKVQDQIEHELALIAELGYEKYFLTVYDIVRFARARHILCQGRGSAANSAVCYCLGITEVDPDRMNVLFERFVSKERAEPPDIDIDFEHQRREEVFQEHMFAVYGRDRAAIVAAVTSFRARSSIRDVGKALGYDLETVDRIAKTLHRWDGSEVSKQRMVELGLDPEDLGIRQLLHLTAEISGFPRQLSQHVGGFVLTRGKLSRIVPIENAAMPDRSVIQWDKDDIDALGLMKVDLLSLGMLSAIRRALDLIGRRRGYAFQMQDIPPEDKATYDMICKADTVGVFQIESRAQMSMLPRMQPRSFYDLVIEVAIVRPGPIQGGMVHPYLRRRQGLEPVSCPPGLERALGRTLGVPLFQEQVMQTAVDAAGFTAGCVFQRSWTPVSG